MRGAAIGVGVGVDVRVFPFRASILHQYNAKPAS